MRSIRVGHLPIYRLLGVTPDGGLRLVIPREVDDPTPAVVVDDAGAIVWRVPGGGAHGVDPVMSDDGRYVFSRERKTSVEDSEVLVLDATNGEILRRLPFAGGAALPTCNHQWRGRAIEAGWVGGNARLLLPAPGGWKVWNLDTGDSVDVTTDEPPDDSFCRQLSPDGTTIARYGHTGRKSTLTFLNVREPETSSVDFDTRLSGSAVARNGNFVVWFGEDLVEYDRAGQEVRRVEHAKRIAQFVRGMGDKSWVLLEPSAHRADAPLDSGKPELVESFSPGSLLELKPPFGKRSHRDEVGSVFATDDGFVAGWDEMGIVTFDANGMNQSKEDLAWGTATSIIQGPGPRDVTVSFLSGPRSWNIDTMTRSGLQLPNYGWEAIRWSRGKLLITPPQRNKLAVVDADGETTIDLDREFRVKDAVLDEQGRVYVIAPRTLVVFEQDEQGWNPTATWVSPDGLAFQGLSADGRFVTAKTTSRDVDRFHVMRLSDRNEVAAYEDTACMFERDTLVCSTISDGAIELTAREPDGQLLHETSVSFATYHSQLSEMPPDVQKRFANPAHARSRDGLFSLGIVAQGARLYIDSVRGVAWRPIERLGGVSFWMGDDEIAVSSATLVVRPRATVDPDSFVPLDD